MSFSIRRVVTTHDAAGKAVIGIDSEIAAREGKPGTGIHACVLWTSDSMPVSFAGDEDMARRPPAFEPPDNGTIFRIIEIPPGSPPYMHRTDTVDYCIVLAGEIDMTLDDGAEVHMNAGDVMIQRGTNHAWANRSGAPCRLAFVLMDGTR